MILTSLTLFQNICMISLLSASHSIVAKLISSFNVGCHTHNVLNPWHLLWTAFGCILLTTFALMFFILFLSSIPSALSSISYHGFPSLIVEFNFAVGTADGFMFWFALNITIILYYTYVMMCIDFRLSYSSTGVVANVVMVAIYELLGNSLIFRAGQGT